LAGQATCVLLSLAVVAHSSSSEASQQRLAGAVVPEGCELSTLPWGRAAAPLKRPHPCGTKAGNRAAPDAADRHWQAVPGCSPYPIKIREDASRRVQKLPPLPRLPPRRRAAAPAPARRRAAVAWRSRPRRWAVAAAAAAAAAGRILATGGLRGDLNQL
jgi:hypothetical protein